MKNVSHTCIIKQKILWKYIKCSWACQTSISTSYFQMAQSQRRKSIPLVSGLVRNPLKCLTNSWFVTFPPFCNIKSRIASTENSPGAAILRTTADGLEQLKGAIRTLPTTIAVSVLLWFCSGPSSVINVSSFVTVVLKYCHHHKPWRHREYDKRLKDFGRKIFKTGTAWEYCM